MTVNTPQNTPIYSATTGFLTDYGKSIGAKPVQPNDPARNTSTPQPTPTVAPAPAPTTQNNSSNITTQAQAVQALNNNQITPAQYTSIVNGFNQNSQTTSTPSTNTNTSTTSTTGQGVKYDPSLVKYGITQDIWTQLSSTQQAVVSVATGAANALYNANASNVTLSQALSSAANDPTITAKYADALKMDTNTFQQNLQQIQQATSTTAQQQQQQFENDRQALAKQQAAAGTAYSGFRQQAQDQLGEQESGIVQSSKSALQQQLNNATSQFEAKYGTSATNPATAIYQDPNASSNRSLSGLYTPSTPTTENLTGTTVGGVTGSNNTAKQQDINNLAGQYVTAGAVPS